VNAARDKTRRLGRPPAVDSSETREQILVAARTAFARRGFDATTNKDIAHGVGLTSGAIYHYFASKVDLYVAVYAEVQDLVYTEFEKAAAQHSTFVDRLAAVLDAAVAVNEQDPAIASFVVGVAGEAQRHPELAPLVRPYRARGLEFVKHLVDDAFDAGEFAPGLTRDAVVDMAFAMLGGLASFSSSTNDVERHRHATAAVQLLLRNQLLASAG
jgi:AcrR family transcriptional regulator